MLDGYTTDYVTMVMTDEAKAALQEGENVLALHCTQTAGGQYVDVGLVSVRNVDLVELLPTSRVNSQEWTFSTAEPGTSNWMTSGFAAEGWTTGPGAFGTVLSGMDNVTVGTPWATPDIWLRKTFTVPEKTYTDFLLNIFYDEDVEVFINGVLVYTRTGYLTVFKQEVLAKGFNSHCPAQGFEPRWTRQDAGATGPRRNGHPFRLGWMECHL